MASPQPDPVSQARALLAQVMRQAAAGGPAVQVHRQCSLPGCGHSWLSPFGLAKLQVVERHPLPDGTRVDLALLRGERAVAVVQLGEPAPVDLPSADLDPQEVLADPHLWRPRGARPRPCPRCLPAIGAPWRGSSGSPPGHVQPGLPIRLVTTQRQLTDLCQHLEQQDLIALDVECNPWTHQLALIQLGTRSCSWIVDPLGLRNLSPLPRLMAREQTRMLIHNAAFERRILGREGMELRGVLDTLKISRSLRGRSVGSHGLAAVCQRELGLKLSKSEQTSEWDRRPLRDSQIAYAALDVEVLMRLAGVFGADLERFVE